MDNMLLENYLASQFKFGFELEAFKTDGKVTFPTSHWDDDQPIEPDEEEDEEEESHWDDDQPIEPDEEEIDKSIQNEIAKAFDFKTNEVKIKSDGSLEPDTEDDYAFEWATPVMNFTPANIKRCIKGLDTLMNDFYYTNDTCGFHVHLSFPNISDADCIWIISKLSLDEDMLYTLTEGVAGCEFYSDDWAEIDFIKDLGDSLRDGNYEGIAPVFSTEKYRMLHIHPQGTIEWRGPRGFMNSVYHIKPVYDFFKLLHKFVMWISKTLASHEINGMSRDNYFKLIFNEDYKENDLIKDFNKKQKEKAAIRRLSKTLKSGDSSKLINLIKKYLDTRDYNLNKDINFLIKVLDDSVSEYSNFIKDLFLKYIAIKDDKLRNEVSKFIQYHNYIISNGFLSLTLDEMFYYFSMSLNSVNDNDCLYTIVVYNSNNEKVIEAFNKALKNCTSQELNKEPLKRIFSNYGCLEKFGKSIKTPEILDIEKLELYLFNCIRSTSQNSPKSLPKILNKNYFKNLNYTFDCYIKVCLTAHENEVLASIFNNLLNKMINYWSSTKPDINNRKEEIYCKYLKNIILTGNTNYELNTQEF